MTHYEDLITAIRKLDDVLKYLKMNEEELDSVIDTKCIYGFETAMDRLHLVRITNEKEGDES